ncbi:carbohydrate ABC transporter membrane protein 2, CUT1 family (TC 3.A.1.1.-) [Arthrobacter sp. ov407]|uniref:carbohydrate ABC transporter permease n=1 Tax=Arthrobacter sp. ov407 TaxID=1761748 RepID=UPI000888814D|nr:carbohydrate ABC transporter permease [Arthrobacter sp. ov407]SDK92970.1 carbohydrate ABC transporter membrane protein 2, CUT1 family (TC 3.A.1.1.-) [Arthrobacter sp. ov407]
MTRTELMTRRADASQLQPRDAPARRLNVWAILRLAAVVGGALMMIAPFLIMVSTSLEPNTATLPNPPHFLPQGVTTSNYEEAWNGNDFAGYFFNSTYVSVLTTVAVVVISSLTAFAFARFDFPGKNFVFAVLLAGLMIPGIVVIVPQFVLAKSLGMLDSLDGLVFFYTAGQIAFTTFLLRAFFERVPRELDEAMTVDGAGIMRKFLVLYVPLARPALATAAVFSFLGSWDEYVWALTVISDASKRTLPLGIAAFQGEHGTAWGLVFAASTMAVLPVIAVYVAGQKHLISGITAGAVK